MDFGISYGWVEWVDDGGCLMMVAMWLFYLIVDGGWWLGVGDFGFVLGL